MAIWKNAFISIAGTDHSADCRSLNMPEGVETVDDTAMGDDFRSNAASLETWTISAEFNAAFGASSIEDTLSTIQAAAAKSAALIVRPDSAVVGAGNPQWAGTGILTSLQVVQGAVGDQHIITAEFVAGSALARTVA